MTASLDRTKCTLWIDYDDTIGGTLVKGQPASGHHAYYDCIDRFVALMEQWGYDGPTARLLQDEIDQERAKRMGFGDKTRFAGSLVLTYEALFFQRSGSYPLVTNTKRVFAIGMSVFTDYPYVPLPGALDALWALRGSYNLVICTKGETETQMQKLRDTGVDFLVDAVRVMSHKDEAEWKALFTGFGYDTPESLAATVAIGNSVKSDVNPPLALGAHGIYLADNDNWAFESAAVAAPLPGRKVTGIDTFASAPTALLDILN